MDLGFLNEALHGVSQAVLFPVIALLLASIAYSLVTLGSLIIEMFVERRHFNVVLPKFQHAIEAANAQTMDTAVETSGLLKPQKEALMELFNNRDLPSEARWALAKRLLFIEQEKNRKRVVRNETMAKVAPMLGLMGTLIPLGPGIVALGAGDTATLSASLLVAFDTTVAGLLSAAVCMVVARVRRTWYASYNEALEASVTTMLEKIDLMAASGTLGAVIRAEIEVKQDEQEDEACSIAV